MLAITLPVAKVQQGDLTLFSTAIKVKTLIQEGFYSVETLDPSSSSDSGYQRLLNKARARKLADYIVRGQQRQDAFLPTSVFLATDKPLSFDAAANEITFNPDEVGPFSVVDGQHRLEGLKMAARKDDRVLEFALPVNIAGDLPELDQMCHFLIVNTTQKSVDKAVEQRIVARLHDLVDVENIPSLPKWIQNLVERGEVNKAVKMVDFLNEVEGSPWRGRIAMANEPRRNAINQRSFVTAIVKYVLTANNPLEAFNDADKERRVFLNYWKAISETIGVDDGSASVLYKYNGVELFCRFSIAFFGKLFGARRFTVPAMKELLWDCLDNVEGEFAGVGHAEWWAPGGKASGLNAAAIAQVAREMTKALHRPSMSAEIEI